ncbi:hypothetical protein HHI36_001245 [Cryptolaemus montrouzieri]|uniref:Uncharacterized protein n=1 Tax=Cryptolaemus montrouzieri TaxID=559131 RepID=A0ABD2P7U1_9CUCU
MRFLDILNNVYIDGTTNNAEGEIIIQVLQNILNIIEVLFGMSVKALADTWKKYCIFIEKYHLILSQESIYCVKEIQIIKQQIKSSWI